MPTEDEIEEDVNLPYYRFHNKPKRALNDTCSINDELEMNRTGQDHLRDTASKIMKPGKSILNCDESVKLGEHLIRHGIHDSDVNRRRFRNLLFNSQRSSEQSIASYISLVVLGNEALYQKTTSGERFREILKSQGILTGIQVDKGTVPMYNNRSNREHIIQGLDNLDERCMSYKMVECDAAKFTAVFKIGPGRPSQRAIQDNVHTLARFASICQTHCLVPIIGCELSVDDDIDVNKSERAMELILVQLMGALTEQQVLLEGIILAPSMCLPGRDCCLTESSAMLVGCASVLSLHRTIPPAVAGIAFLTTGQELEECCLNLDIISKNMMKSTNPWPFTSILGEALLEAVVSIWGGYDSATIIAESELLKWIMINSLASRGVYVNVKEESDMEAENETPVQDSISITQ